MQKLLKKIFTVSYLDNEGARRICFIFGVLLALIPVCLFFSRVYVSQDTTLREAVVSAPIKQQRYVFEHYPYKCNFCDLESNFERWRATFGSWKYTNDLRHTNCSKLRDPGSCGSAQRYIMQRVKVGYFDSAAFSFLPLAVVLFYIPFIFGCLIKWIMLGFNKKGKPQKTTPKTSQKKKAKAKKK